MKIFSSQKFALTGYLLFACFLFFYTFTQIDLSLTISHNSMLQDIQRSFQSIGYFNRQVSAQLFLFIVLGMFLFFLLLLRQIRKKRIKTKTFWYLVGGMTLLFVFSYNAFSYDLFNYIFDAKIVTFYQENPYMKKALDFPGDPMLSFMHWTHRVYPYGPLWLGITVPLSYLGIQKFIVTFFLFKLLMAAAFLGTGYYIFRILKKISPDHAMFGAAVFLLNPFIILESVISAHNDIVMLFFAILGVFFLVRRKPILSYGMVLVSIGIKFATVFLVPAIAYAWYSEKRKKTIHWEKVFVFMLCGMGVAVIAASIRTNFQPWYFLYLMPFMALVPNRNSVFSPMIILSVTAVCNYLPFLSTGNWDPPIPAYLLIINTFGVLIAVIAILFSSVRGRQK